MADDSARPKPRKPSPALALWFRMGAAHFAAYPVAFAAAMAGVPLAMVLRGNAVLTAASEAAAQRVIMEVCLVFAALVYVLVHVVAIPWARGAAAVAREEPDAPGRARKGRVVFIASVLAMSAGCVLGGLVGWAWLLTS
jgi:hypothetical protein